MGIVHFPAQNVLGILGSCSVETLALSAAATYGAFGFVCPVDASKTLDKVMIYCTAVTGTLVAGDLRCRIYDCNSSMNPNTLQATSTTVTALPTGAAWVEFTGLSCSLTAGTMYWAVIDCPNAGSSRYITIRDIYNSGHGTSPGGNASSSTNWGMAFKRSTDSGGTWATNPRAGVGCFRLEYSDPAYDALPASNWTTQSSSYGIYAARLYGAYFVTPSVGKMIVRGLISMGNRVGTPSIGYQLKLYTGASPSLQRTTGTIPYGVFSTTTYTHIGWFSSPITLDPSTTVRIVGATSDGSSGSSSNYFRIAGLEINNNANSFATGPFQGSWRETYYNGSSWAERQTIWPNMGLILDTDGEFASSGGAGMIVHPGMAGGMRG